MAVTVTHSTVATLPDEAGAEINKAEWNANHTVTGLGTFATADAATPPAIGTTTPAAGAFTTFSASGAVSGAGMSAYLASPPSIGSTAAGTGAFTTLSASSTVSGAGFDAYLASPPAIGGTAAGTVKGTTITATTQIVLPTGAVGTPSLIFGAGGPGMYSAAANFLTWTFNGTGNWATLQNSGTTQGFRLANNMALGWSSSTDSTNASDTTVGRVSANAIQFAGGVSAVTGGQASARTELNKTVTGIADATPTLGLTFTIPNNAHTASFLVHVSAAIGAGGAIGTNEASNARLGIVTITRTPGVNAVATYADIGTSGSAAVAGATTCAIALAMGAVSGAVGASNTLPLNVTVTKGGGSSANHIAQFHCTLLNMNATGITVA